MVKVSIIQYLMFVDYLALILYLLPVASFCCLLKVAQIISNSIKKKSKYGKLLLILNGLFLMILSVGVSGYLISSDIPNKESLIKERKTENANYL
jgi:hypothetical protein